MAIRDGFIMLKALCTGQTRRMVALTVSLVGLQFTWSVEMTYFTPYLLELGLEKSQIALVWFAPPISGMIMQPVIGAISDSSTMRWGRRRPFMLIASYIVAICLVTLAWASEICRAFIEDEELAQKSVVALAVLCIYVLDFAINVVQATSRSLIVDVLPLSEQQQGSAWAGRMLGLGTLFGYTVGTLDLSRFFGNTIGVSQIQQICVIASTTLVCCVTVTCYSVKERPLPTPPINHVKKSVLQLFLNVAKTALQLPRKIQALCWITFWSWIAWSPFHVYSSTWAGENYYLQNKTTQAELRASTDVAGDLARKGSQALVFFSLTSFVGSVLLPWIVLSPQHGRTPLTRMEEPGRRTGLRRFRACQPDIITAWGLSQLLLSASIIWAPFPSSFLFSTFIIAFCGIPWAMYGWAPLALLGEEINKMDLLNGQRTNEETTELDCVSLIPNSPPEPAALNIRESGLPVDDAGQPAGVYLGIWNIYATIPQLIASLIAMVAFHILEPGRSLEWALDPATPEPGDASQRIPIRRLSGTAACLVVGAFCSLVAAILTFRLRKM